MSRSDVDLATSMSLRHFDLSKARCFAVTRPKLSGRRSSWTVLNQVCLGRILKNGLDWCRHDRGDQRKTGAVDGHYLTGVAVPYETGPRH